jgi:hypothetical protein
MGALLRGAIWSREGEEGNWRGRRAVSRAGGEAVQPSWAPLPKPPSHERRGKGLEPWGPYCLGLNTTPAEMAPGKIR